MEAKIKGPFFKDTHHYLTAEGYPLGTECYYYYVYFNGLVRYCCGDTIEKAWEKTIKTLRTEQAREKEYTDGNGVLQI